VESFNSNVGGIVILSILTLVALGFLFGNADIWLPISLIWGFVGIARARTYENIVGHSAWVLVGILFALLVVQLLVQGYWVAAASQKREPVKPTETPTTSSTYTFSSY